MRKFPKITSHDIAVRRTLIAFHLEYKQIGELSVDVDKLLKHIPEETLQDYIDSRDIDWSEYE